MRAKKYAALAASLTALAAAGLAASPAAGQNQSVTVNDVVAKVNRAGGITVSGAMNCKAAVDAAAPVPDTVPNYNVMVSVTWTATQAIGRKGRVTASWTGGGHADPCYFSWGDDEALPWNTSWFGSSGTDYYVVPANGKFVKGPVLVDVKVESFYDEQGNASPNVYASTPPNGDIIGPTDSIVEVFGVTQFTVRAR